MGITLVLVLRILKITIFATVSGEYHVPSQWCVPYVVRVVEIRDEFVKVIIGLA